MTAQCARTRRVLGLCTALLAATALPASSQAAPNPLGQPMLEADGSVRDDAFIPVPLLPEDQKYADLQADRLKQFLMEVDAISLADRDRGTVFWGRNIGTQGHKDTQDWVERHFLANGLENVHRQYFDLGPQWKPERWDITFASGGENFELESARPAEDAATTPAAGLEFELVWVAGGSDADYLGRDVRGKAVLIQDVPLPGDIRHLIAIEGAVARAFQKGAGAVGIVYGISDNMAMWQDISGGPGFNLGYEDGIRLRDRLGKGERVTVNLQMQSQMVEGMQEASVWGTLPGASEEDILIVAHMDGYFQAASDNGSGLAVMMGLIEHFSKIPQAQRPRSIRFLGSVGHHSGPGTAWLHDNAATALANTVLIINLEHSSLLRTKYWGPKLRMTNAVSPLRWWVWGSPALLDATLESLRRFRVELTADMDPGAAGEISRIARDAPSIQLISSPEIKHTEQDTPEWVPAIGLEKIARAYARIIDEVNELEREEILPSQVSAQAQPDAR